MMAATRRVHPQGGLTRARLISLQAENHARPAALGDVLAVPVLGPGFEARRQHEHPLGVDFAPHQPVAHGACTEVAEFAQIVKSELAKWGPVVKASGFSSED